MTTTDHSAGRPRSVFLLGMHRSGTSVLARALGELGLWLGDEKGLLEAHPSDNPTGYWERHDVHDLHVGYLDERGYDWNRLAGFVVRDEDVAAATSLQDALVRIIDDLDAHAPWLVKDPRLSMMLPLWWRQIPDAVSVVAVRHPLEIARSLRDTPRGRYATPFLLLLWQKYMTRMIADLGERRVIYVSYQALLDDPVGQVRRVHGLLQAAGVDELTLPPDERITALFNRDLRRQHATDDRSLTPDQRDLFGWLQSAAADPDAVAAPVDRWPEPDQELAEFEASADFFIDRGRSLASIDVQRHLTEVAGQMREQAMAHQQQLAVLQARHQARRARQTHVRRRLVEHLRAARKGLDDTLIHVDNVEAMLHEATTHARNLEEGLADTRRSLSWRLTAPLRWLPGLLSIRLPAGSERWLYRFYYRLPGLNADRKRSAIVWLHRTVPWLTRHTVSYRLYRMAGQVTPAAIDRWLRADSDEERAAALARLPRRPRVSILMPVYNTDPEFLQAAIDSVRAQSYPDWQLCIADDASTRAETLAVLDALDEPRIEVVRSSHNTGIALASNRALAAADGELVGLLDHDDLLAPDALLVSVMALIDTGADFVYSDEDKIDSSGNHVHPHFKPDYSADYLFSSNYLCHFSVMRRSLLTRIGGFREGFDGAQDFDLFLRYMECARKVTHVPRVLYHWRMHEASTAASSDAKPKSWEAGRKAVADALVRRGIDATAELGPYPNTYRIRHAPVGSPLVSVIVPFKDKSELLRNCVASVLEKGGYENFELLLVDNRSSEPSTRRLLEQLGAQDDRIRVLQYDAPFNYSAINNWAATHARGEMLLFLNNDIKAISQDWLLRLLEHAQRPDVGVVGALLLYEDGTVQHGGVITGLGGVAGHAHLFERGDSPGYFSRLQLTQELSAVTFACAMTRREVFQALGGLNETDLAIAFNDIDYCLRARERGLKVIYMPEARLHHYESKSRGLEDTPEKQARFEREVAYMLRRHADAIDAGDPFYNPNFTLQQPSFTIRAD